MGSNDIYFKNGVITCNHCKKTEKMSQWPVSLAEMDKIEQFMEAFIKKHQDCKFKKYS